MNNFLLKESVKLLKVLSDFTRFSILKLLKEERKSSSELEEILDKSQSTVSKHLKILKEADLISSKRKGRRKYYGVKNPRILEIIAAIKNFVIQQKKAQLESLKDLSVSDTLFD
jgi:DNA-binding transcriptional ArsR family regulator